METFVAQSNATVRPIAFREIARHRFRALFELATLVGVALFIVVVLSSVMRVAEYVISTKLAIAEAQAASPSVRDEYRATLLLRTAKQITMSPGETKLFTVGYKNAGTVTWQNSGPRFLSIYTVSPNYRNSVFAHASWRSPEEPAIMKDPSVQPGAVGFFDITLQAPTTLGAYHEAFHLVAEDTLWLPGGGFEIDINVVPRPTVSAPAPVPIAAPTPAAASVIAPTSIPASNDYAATLLLRSHKTEVALGPGETVDMTVAFKNSGTKLWNVRSLRAPEIAIAITPPSFHHLSWAGPNEVVRATDVVQPGALGFLKFTLQAPQQKGSYLPSFQLVADDVVVPGGQIDIPITVTADGITSSAPALLPTVEIIPEPTVRVGLFKTDRPVMVTANGDYDILQDGVVVESVTGGQPTKVIFDFNYKTYTVTSPNGTKVYPRPVRFVTRDQTNGVFTLPSYEHHPGWNANLNDNMFRQSIEVYQAENTGNLWVINELPMEKYLYGLAETSNPTHVEFQKALATVARTYAFYHWTRDSKHNGHFHVDATFDQVYRGYASEIRMPQWVQSVDASRGAIVTYQNEIALTPYYSRSDGRTRSWEEVWGGGPKPWLKSVPTPYDAGQTLWGHGVGMSARDALLRAREGGASWQDIIKYYYTGVDVVKKWN